MAWAKVIEGDVMGTLAMTGRGTESGEAVQVMRTSLMANRMTMAKGVMLAPNIWKPSSSWKNHSPSLHRVARTLNLLSKSSKPPSSLFGLRTNCGMR